MPYTPSIAASFLQLTRRKRGVYGIFRRIHAGKYGIIRTSSTTKAFSMALIPSFETILLEVHQSLGLERPQSSYISKFSDLGLSLETHKKMAEKLLAEIFSALEMDPEARHDASYNMLHWAGFHKALELNTWTSSASDKQVLWHLLAYAYVPGLARDLAFWSLDGMRRKQPFDAGMPGGEFWFLPHWDTENNTLQLPVPKVIDWLLDLLDLLDAPSLQGLNTELGRKNIREDGENYAVVRTLQNWRKGSTPKSSAQIEQLFPNDATLNFSGVFLLDENLTAENQFQAARALALRKGLNAKTLRDQIPMTVDRLEPIVNGCASEEEKQEFVRLIALRYAKPSMPTIRQRLRIARMAQDGYERLLKTLCGTEVEPTCTDPAQNKLLQLLALFQNIYNLTIDAWKNADTVEEEDAWFEARLAPWDKADLLLSIVPSQKKTAYLTLAERLTRKFMLLEQDSPLEDLVPLGDGGANAEAVVKRRIFSLQQEHEEDLRLMALSDKVRRSSPWRALEAETSYWILSQFAHEKALSPNARSMAIKRMRDVAATPGQTVQAIMLELHFLNCEPKQRPKDVQQRVQLLLDEAQASQGYEEWKAPLLRLRAKHRLMQNDFQGACKDFKAALDACSERGFGAARGEIARDGFATQIAVVGFEPTQQERYYRNMLSYDIFPDGKVSMEDAAALSEEFFWSDLYHPYPGFQREERLTKEVFEKVLVETFGLIEGADWDGLGLWMKRHAKQLRKVNFKDSRRDSVLLLWLKMLHTAEKNLPAIKVDLPLDLISPFAQVEQHVLNRRKAIELLIEAWPEQAKIADFKGQTPLMLVADNGHPGLTGLLAPLSDMAAQDYLGRTVLHSAVTGRSPECVAIVLARYHEDAHADVEKATHDEENTALHTAVRFGQPETVQLILDAFPGLASNTNVYGHTPLEMAREILENLPATQALMHKNNRRTGSKEDFEAIIALLERKAA